MTVRIVDETVVITSALSVEDIKMLSKNDPKALVLKDEEGEPIFKIGLGAGGIGRYGIEFDSKSQSGKASLSYLVKVPEGKDIKDVVADVDGPALLKLSQAEAEAQAALATLADQKAEVLGRIQVIDEPAEEVQPNDAVPTEE